MTDAGGMLGLERMLDDTTVLACEGDVMDPIPLNKIGPRKGHDSVLESLYI